MLPISVACKQIVGFPTNMLRKFCMGFLIVLFGGDSKLLVFLSYHIEIHTFGKLSWWL